MSIGLGSTLLEDMGKQYAEKVSFLGFIPADITTHNTLLVGVALFLMIISFLLIFSNREDEVDY